MHNCSGRIHLVATNGAGAFYEKCGFIGLQEAQDGLKYFDPIPERLDLLFSKRKYFLFLKRTTKPETKIMPLERLKQQCRELFNQKERS